MQNFYTKGTWNVTPDINKWKLNYWKRPQYRGHGSVSNFVPPEKWAHTVFQLMLLNHKPSHPNGKAGLLKGCTEHWNMIVIALLTITVPISEQNCSMEIIFSVTYLHLFCACQNNWSIVLNHREMQQSVMFGTNVINGRSKSPLFISKFEFNLTLKASKNCIIIIFNIVIAYLMYCAAWMSNILVLPLIQNKFLSCIHCTGPQFTVGQL